MANAEHLDILKQGVEVWNQWRVQNPETKPDLYWADLHGANLRGANLRGADLQRATLWETVFGDTNLVDAKGLDQCIHYGPSTIDFRTLQSSGFLAPPFLRGCGLPETFIEYLPSLFAGSALQFYSCFISYSSKDQDLAERLYNDLQGKGVRCWYAPEDLKIGEEIRQSLFDSVRLYDKLLLILSEQSLRSPWVKSEVEAALEKERKSGKIMLFPIRLDGTVLQTEAAWAAEVRNRHIGDFTNWKNHDAFKKSFARRLRDLKEGTVPAK